MINPIRRYKQALLALVALNSYGRVSLCSASLRSGQPKIFERAMSVLTAPRGGVTARVVLLGALCATLTCDLTSPLYGQDQTTETSSDFQITWTDRGINQYELGQNAGAVLPQADGAELIQLSMPGDQMMPKTPAEWAKYGESMKGFFRAKISAARAAGFTRIEVLTQQNIGSFSYVSPSQQGDVTKFTNEIGQALLSTKNNLQGEGINVTVDGVFGSNGGRAIAATLPSFSADGENLFNHVTYVDARAAASNVQQGCQLLSEGCTIVHTVGELPAPKIGIALPGNDEGQPLIANRSVAETLQSSKVRVLEVDVTDANCNIVGQYIGCVDKHIAPMRNVGDSQLIQVREWTGTGYSKPQWMSKGEFIGLAGGQATNAPPALSGKGSEPSLPKGWQFNPDLLSQQQKQDWLKNQEIVAGETAALSGKGTGTSLPKGWQFNPDVLSPQQKQDWLNNQGIVASETNALSGKGTGTSLPKGWQFSPDVFSPQQKQDWLKNQAIIAGETNALSGNGSGTSLPKGWQFNPDVLSPEGKEGWLRAQAVMRNETLNSTQSSDILSAIYGTDPEIGYPAASKQSSDGRLTATMQWSFKNQGGVIPAATGSWVVSDQGQYVGTYSSDVSLMNGGKFQVLTTPGASAILTPDGKPRAPVYTTYDSGLEIQEQQFFLANRASLRNSGYAETQAFGGGVFAGFKVGHGWDLLDSQGKNLGDGVFQRVKPLIGGAFAVSKDSFGGDWQVFDASGHRLGDGTYADVEVQNGQIEAWKQIGGGSPVYLVPPSSNSVPVQQPPTTAVSTNSVNSGVRSQTASSLSASQGESILQQARRKNQDLQSQHQNLLQHLQSLDQQVREASQQQVPIQQLAPIPSSGTRNPVTPAAVCPANKSASRCGAAPRSSQPATLVRPAVAQHTSVSSGGANHIPVSSKPTAPPPAPPHLPPPVVPPKVPVAPIRTK